MFSTVDGTDNKVGVIGSEKGMTQFEKRGKHVFEKEKVKK